jgi:hypothetical protein
LPRDRRAWRLLRLPTSVRARLAKTIHKLDFFHQKPVAFHLRLGHIALVDGFGDTRSTLPQGRGF